MFILRSFLALELFRKSVCDPRNSIRVAGDIKPENIFLYHYNEQLIPVIGDFDGRSLRKSGFDVNGTIKEDEGISRTSIYVFEDKNKTTKEYFKKLIISVEDFKRNTPPLSNDGFNRSYYYKLSEELLLIGDKFQEYREFVKAKECYQLCLDVIESFSVCNAANLLFMF